VLKIQFTNDEIKSKLGVFNLKSLERKILMLFLEKKVMQASKVQNYLSKKGPYIYKILAELQEKGWLEVESLNPKHYRIVSKEKFKEKLNQLIELTQEKLDLQKKNYHAILTAYDAFASKYKNKKLESESGEKLTAEKEKVTEKMSLEEKFSKIPEKAPSFIKKWMKEVLVENEMSKILKTEVNMGIKLKKGEIVFTLNSVEFQFNTKPLTYGGAIFCHFPTEVKDTKIFNQTHVYNEDMLKMAYTMEEKGFSDEKQARSLKSFRVESGLMEKAGDDPSGNGQRVLSSIFLKINSKEIEGKLTTLNISENKDWIVTYWAEKPEFFSLIENLLLGLEYSSSVP